jgi:hypothetical protein
VLDSGQAFTRAAIARALGISRTTEWQFRKAYPLLETWLNAQLERAMLDRTGVVLYKLALIASRGSEPHARLFLQAMGRLGPRLGEPLLGMGTTIQATGPTIVHLAVPRPGDPPVAASPAMLKPIVH